MEMAPEVLPKLARTLDRMQEEYGVSLVNVSDDADYLRVPPPRLLASDGIIANLLEFRSSGCRLGRPRRKLAAMCPPAWTARGYPGYRCRLAAMEGRAACAGRNRMGSASIRESNNRQMAETSATAKTSCWPLLRWTALVAWVTALCAGPLTRMTSRPWREYPYCQLRAALDWLYIRIARGHNGYARGTINLCQSCQRPDRIHPPGDCDSGPQAVEQLPRHFATCILRVMPRRLRRVVIRNNDRVAVPVVFAIGVD